MDSIPTAASRQTVYDNAIAYEGSQEQADDIAATQALEKAQLHQEIANHICQWACTTDYKDDFSGKNEMFIPVAQLDVNIVSEWETTLTGNGYIFENINPYSIRIALP